jgi:hypothetical protein
MLGGEVVLDENSISPFWRLDFSRKDDGKLGIKATLAPEPTDEEIEKLVSDMAGTDVDIREAIAKAKMDWMPITSLMGRLRNHIIYDQTTNKWRRLSTQPPQPCNNTTD